MKRLKTFSLISVSLGGLLLASVTSCTFRAYGSSSTTSLILWESEQNRTLFEGDGTTSGIIDDFIDYYEDKYPQLKGKVSITFNPQEEGSAVSNLSTYASSGQGADVFAFANDTLSSAVENNLIDPLDYRETLVSEYFSDDSIEALSLENENGVMSLYAYPYATETSILIYNKEVLSTEDVSSWENLKASGKRVLFDIDGKVSNTDAGYYIRMFLTAAKIFKDSQGNVSSSKNDFTITQDQNVENLYYFFSEINSKQTIYAGLADTAYQHLTSPEGSETRVDAVITTPYNYNVLMNTTGSGEDIASKIAVAPLPTLNGQTLTPFNGYKAYGVSRYSSNPALAHEFAYYLSTNLEVLSKRAQIGVNPVIKESKLESSNYAALAYQVSKNECTNVVASTLKNGDLMPSVSAFGKYWSSMSAACRDLYGSDSASLSKESIKSILTTVETNVRS